MSALVRAEHDSVKASCGIIETEEMVQLQRQIDANCGEYAVGGRGKWGKVLGHTTQTGNWWWGRWELLCWRLGLSSPDLPFSFRE